MDFLAVWTLEPPKVKIDDIPNFWKRKIGTAFRAYDRNNDGTLCYEDLMGIGDYFVKTGKMNRKHADLVYTSLKKTAEGTADPPCDMVTFIRNIYANLIKKDKEQIAKLNLFEVWNIWFSALDADDDNYLTLDEYKILWDGFGLDPRFADIQFSWMDTDGDGKVSREEFQDAYRDYVTNLDTDENNINRFFGPLIEL
ncbi:unnamed protein product [Owenia fusiformis]|uniref:Uncharacterized protein n=1 Tax=Owenia fusiformis TaxID=6347 RepID=A0A8J1UF35_OWEFU|nr:unnamed protein product [Owenia fusiformis]